MIEASGLTKEFFVAKRQRGRRQRLHRAGLAGARLGQHADGRADLPRRAEAALQCVMRDKGRLHRVQRIAVGQAFDGGEVTALLHHGQRQAGLDAPPVAEDRAGAALAAVAAFLGAGQVHHFAQRVEQGGAGLELQGVGLAVDPEGDGSCGIACGRGGIAPGGLLVFGHCAGLLWTGRHHGMASCLIVQQEGQQIRCPAAGQACTGSGGEAVPPRTS